MDGLFQSKSDALNRALVSPELRQRTSFWEQEPARVASHSQVVDDFLRRQRLVKPQAYHLPRERFFCGARVTGETIVPGRKGVFG